MQPREEVKREPKPLEVPKEEPKPKRFRLVKLEERIAPLMAGDSPCTRLMSGCI